MKRAKIEIRCPWCEVEQVLKQKQIMPLYPMTIEEITKYDKFEQTEIFRPSWKQFKKASTLSCFGYSASGAARCRACSKVINIELFVSEYPFEEGYKKHMAEKQERDETIVKNKIKERDNE